MLGFEEFKEVPHVGLRDAISRAKLVENGFNSFRRELIKLHHILDKGSGGNEITRIFEVNAVANRHFIPRRRSVHAPPRFDRFLTRHNLR